MAGVKAPTAAKNASGRGGALSTRALAVVATGVLGSLMAGPLLRWLRVDNEAVHGFTLGLVAHAIGVARVMQTHPGSVAFAALAMGLNGVATALLPVGMALTFPCVTALLSKVVPKDERGMYMGLQQTFGGVARLVACAVFQLQHHLRVQGVQRGVQRVGHVEVFALLAQVGRAQPHGKERALELLYHPRQRIARLNTTLNDRRAASSRRSRA